MNDIRVKQLAKNLISYSVELKKGEKVLIDTSSTNVDLAKELVKEAYRVGGIPYIKVSDSELSKEFIEQCTEDQLDPMVENDLSFMKEMDAYIAIRASNNIFEMSSVPPEKMILYSKKTRPVIEYRVEKTKWCILRYPNYSMAQLSAMSSEAFEDLYFKVCNLDYSKMSEAMENLVDLMHKTDKVRLVGPNTDLKFSIKDLPAIKCAGKMNIPDGEVFTAPVKDSINGKITYNCPSIYQGVTFDNICLEFKKGRIVKATSNNTERLNSILDTDEGARSVGEFAIGVNPYIEKPMRDILFDEKIMGSIHFTPGNCYDDCNNGNKSSVHWDLVMIQTPEYGGGEIYFDNKLIRKDGRFILPELECLNPENLI